MKITSLLIFIFSLIYFSVAVYYYTTGFMGTMFWVLFLLPVAYSIYVLYKLEKGSLYPRLGKWQNLVAAIYLALCLFSALYLPMNYMDLIYYRAGSYNVLDKFVGFSMFFLILEFARREHKVLFALMIFLFIYCVYGEHFPGILKVPSIDPERLILSSTVEIKLGMFGVYAQAGVGIIGAFLLLMGVAKGYGVDRAMIKTIIGYLGKKPALIPQSAVVGSMSVAMCTGSGAADSALVGQFTIPAMKRAGFPALHAAATEGSAALGGLIMPPVMAIAAFLMAEFLAVSYFEVMIRGFVLGFLYYIAIVLTVYLLTLQYIRPGVIKIDGVLSELGEISVSEKLYTLAFFSSLILLIFLMGYLWWPEVRSALITAVIFMTASSVILVFTHSGSLREKAVKLLQSIKETIKGYPEIVVEIILLLAVLGVIINLFTVSGWLLKFGMTLISVGKESLILLIVLGFLLAFFLGFGLPPSAVYIIASVLVTPAMISLGINPWVAHFFVFLVAAISEFTPPVALIAAVTSKIAETSFVKTAIYTQKWILPIYLMIFSVISWPELVVEPGLQMLLAFAIVLLGILIITLGSFGKFAKRGFIDFTIRTVLVLIGILILFSPVREFSHFLALLAIPVLLLGIVRMRRLLLS
uniref:TRAP transporter fused permease subunit n=1 Tax=Archaeoglobus fulgidus TaxID=2234 RepID=A0A7J2THW3_ARCFL